MIGRTTVVLGCCVALVALGCGDAAASRDKHFADLARHTPDSLGKELVTRFNALDANAKAFAAKSASAAAESGKAAEKTKANPITPEFVIADVAKKAKAIADPPPAAVYAEIMVVVDRSILSAAAKERIRNELKAAMKL